MLIKIVKHNNVLTGIPDYHTALEFIKNSCITGMVSKRTIRAVETVGIKFDKNKKLSALKEIKTLTGTGLRECKTFIDSYWEQIYHK